MNWLRYALIAGICAVSYLLFLKWNTFQEAETNAKFVSEETLTSDASIFQSTVTETSHLTPTTINNDSDDLPTFTDDANTLPKINIENAPVQAKLVSVKTDRFDILIDTHGGDLVHVALRKHLAKINEKNSPFVLMKRTESHTYVAQSGLIGPNGTDKSAADRPNYRAASASFEMQENDNTLVVDLMLDDDTSTITKRFTFKRDSYLIDIDYIIQNKSNQLWRAAPYGQIRRNEYEVESNVGFGMQPYLGAAITTNEKNYDKVSFSDIEDEKVTVNKTGGWISMVQHYFISAWVPDQTAPNKYAMKKNSNGIYILEYTGNVKTIEPGNTETISSAFYAGPKNLKTLEAISPYLDLTLDYSFLWFIAKPLFSALDFIHGYVGNWGVAIILLTMLIKLIFFYPSAMSYRSMAKMRKLQPLMAELKERYGDDKQKMSAELMKTYKREKVNPLGGCLPILLQMPVFISLYWVLMESVELRHAPFALWITDLSVKDPFFILPLIMGATMFIQQKLNPTPPDPMQAKVMQMMPIFFTVLFLMFPAGLVLYWVVNNTLSITQQYVITRQIEKGSA